jgi:hypothetical protein
MNRAQLEADVRALVDRTSFTAVIHALVETAYARVRAVADNPEAASPWNLIARLLTITEELSERNRL